jgi:hypothetical protein
VLTLKAVYSRNPHKDTARCRHLPNVLAARDGLYLASAS